MNLRIFKEALRIKEARNAFIKCIAAILIAFIVPGLSSGVTMSLIASVISLLLISDSSKILAIHCMQIRDSYAEAKE